MIERGARILVFARAPVPGLVKTRLAATLGAVRACEIHRRLVERTLEVGAQSAVPVELWVDGDLEHRDLRRWARRYDLTLFRQCHGDLGARLCHAMNRARRRAARVVVVGSDCATLQARDLRQAVRDLRRTDAVLAPALDGGYVLIGAARPLPEALFRRVPWGTRRVLAVTRRRLQRLGWRYRLLRRQLDIDRAADLARLASPVRRRIEA